MNRDPNPQHPSNDDARDTTDTDDFEGLDIDQWIEEQYPDEDTALELVDAYPSNTT